MQCSARRIGMKGPYGQVLPARNRQADPACGIIRASAHEDRPWRCHTTARSAFRYQLHAEPRTQATRSGSGVLAQYRSSAGIGRNASGARAIRPRNRPTGCHTFTRIIVSIRGDQPARRTHGPYRIASTRMPFACLACKAGDIRWGKMKRLFN